MTNRLYRSRSNQMLAGVCGGLGDYLKIDANLIRFFFVLLALGSGVGLVMYLILWVIIPYQDKREASAGDTKPTGANEIAQRVGAHGADAQRAFRDLSPKAVVILGSALIILGVLFLFDTLHLPWLRWLRFDVLWPVLVIGAGVVMLMRHFRRD